MRTKSDQGTRESEESDFLWQATSSYCSLSRQGQETSYSTSQASISECWQEVYQMSWTHDIKECKWPENACLSCGKTGHSHRTCTERTIPPIYCFKCGQRGHKASDCKEPGRLLGPATQFGRPQGGLGQRAPAKVYALQHRDTSSVDTISGTLRILQYDEFFQHLWIFCWCVWYACGNYAYIFVCKYTHWERSYVEQDM